MSMNSETVCAGANVKILLAKLAYYDAEKKALAAVAAAGRDLGWDHAMEGLPDVGDYDGHFGRAYAEGYEDALETIEFRRQAELDQAACDKAIEKIWPSGGCPLGGSEEPGSPRANAREAFWQGMEDVRGGIDYAYEVDEDGFPVIRDVSDAAYEAGFQYGLYGDED